MVSLYLTVAIVTNRPKPLSFSTLSTLSTIAPLLVAIVQESEKNLSPHCETFFPIMTANNKKSPNMKINNKLNPNPACKYNFSAI